jgi:hypothetical protein
MHPDIQRDINQKIDAGLITLMDAKILNKYLAERQTFREKEGIILSHPFIIPLLTLQICLNFQFFN